MDSKDFTFLIPHTAGHRILHACIDSIVRFHDDATIIVSQNNDDAQLREAVAVADTYQAEMIFHDGWFGNACESLFRACRTKYAVYLEADIILLSSLQSLMDEMEKVHFIGVEEVIPLREGLPTSDRKWLRNAPNYFTHSFFMINIERFVQEYGADGIYLSDDLPIWPANPIEPTYGISQRVADWNLKKMVVRPTEYGYGTVYGEEIFHMWFGSWRVRKNIEEACGFPPSYIEATEERILSDYWKHEFHP